VQINTDPYLPGKVVLKPFTCCSSGGTYYRANGRAYRDAN
jgi:hypothetical protein